MLQCYFMELKLLLRGFLKKLSPSKPACHSCLFLEDTGTKLYRKDGRFFIDKKVLARWFSIFQDSILNVPETTK